jgi:hypothetical protein
MSAEPTGTHRRRRRRATAAQGAPPAQEQPGAERALPEQRVAQQRAAEQRAAEQPAAEQPPPEPPAAAPPKPARKGRPPRDGGERGLRDLVGAGPSQLGVSGALRGRDVNRPTEEDLAEAEQSVVIVRRHWTPPDSR